MVLGQVDVEIGDSSGLFRIEAEGSRPSRCGGVDQDLLGGMMHRVTDHEGASLCLAGPILGIGIDLTGRLLNRPAHEIDVRRGIAEFGDHELRRMRAQALQDGPDQATGAAVPAGGDTRRPEPESGTLEIEAGRSDRAMRRHGRPPKSSVSLSESAMPTAGHDPGWTRATFSATEMSNSR